MKCISKSILVVFFFLSLNVVVQETFPGNWEANYKGDLLISEVMDSFIISTYTKTNDEIIFEIIAANGKKPTITGNTKLKDEDIPEVKSYLVNGRQKAILV